MGFLKQGKIVEQEFAKALENFNKANKYQDMNEHWDLSTEIKFDIKGLKKIKRKDSEYNEDIIWVEIVNVNGKKGWLYGKAHYFVFELKKYWLLVDKRELQKLVETNTIKEYKDKAEINYLYNRKGRRDVLTLLHTIDVIHIGCLIEKEK